VSNIVIYFGAHYCIGHTIVRQKEAQEMSADIARAMHKARIERYEKIRCPKNYCRIERN
jgi:hypothetical protein